MYSPFVEMYANQARTVGKLLAFLKTCKAPFYRIYTDPILQNYISEFVLQAEACHASV